MNVEKRVKKIDRRERKKCTPWRKVGSGKGMEESKVEEGEMGKRKESTLKRKKNWGGGNGKRGEE